MNLRTLQNENTLIAVEKDIASFDENRLARAKALLQSDLWTVESRLDDRPGDKQLVADRDRLTKAIKRIDGRLQKQ